MHKNKPDDVTVKLTKNALKQLEKKARPFESKKDCLERIITQNCGASNESVAEETEEKTESQEESEE